VTLTYSEDNQHLTRKLAGIPLFITFVKKKGSMYTPARSLIFHLHALTRNEPARAIVTDKFNTFTLEQELNMDETLREFFNDVYEITRQIPRGKVLTYGRIAALAGRWQKLGENPLVVCDTGHNPHGIAYAAEQLKATPHKELYCVIGFVRDKDLAHILPLLPRDAHYIFTQAQTERALPAAELTAKAAIYGLRGETIPEVPAAVAHARELAAADDMVFIGGSTYVVAEAL